MGLHLSGGTNLSLRQLQQLGQAHFSLHLSTSNKYSMESYSHVAGHGDGLKNRRKGKNSECGGFVLPAFPTLRAGALAHRPAGCTYSDRLGKDRLISPQQW
jgi:hypothetical protein